MFFNIVKYVCVCIYIYIHYLDFYPQQLIQNSRSDESREKIMQKALVPIFNNLLISDLFRNFTFVCVHTCQKVVFYCY